MQRSLQAVKGDQKPAGDSSPSTIAAAADASQAVPTALPKVFPGDGSLPWGPELEALGFARISSPRLESDGWEIQFDPQTGAQLAGSMSSGPLMGCVSHCEQPSGPLFPISQLPMHAKVIALFLR